MKHKNAFVWALLILVVTAAATAWVYPRLPATLVTHWSAQGTPNGTIPRFWGAWLIPMLMAGLLALFWVLPAIDPRRQNYAAFRSAYHFFVIGITLFLAYIHAITLAWNLGYHLPLTRALSPALGGVFIASAWLLRSARPNWFVGIRTPWTLSSPTVWERTHRLAFPIFLVGGVIAVLGVVWEPALWIGLAIVLLGAFGAVVYSYMAYQAENHPPSGG